MDYLPLADLVWEKYCFSWKFTIVYEQAQTAEQILAIECLVENYIRWRLENEEHEDVYFTSGSARYSDRAWIAEGEPEKGSRLEHPCVLISAVFLYI